MLILMGRVVTLKKGVLRMAAILLPSLLLAGALPSEPQEGQQWPTDASNAQSHYEKAEALARDHQYEEAIKEYRLELQEVPQNEAAYFGIALAQTHLERNLEAVQSYLEALRINPNLWEAELNLGILLISEKDWARALFHLERAHELNPKSFQATFYTAKAQLLLEKPAQAEQNLLSALQLADTRIQKFDACAALGSLYLKKKDYSKAEGFFLEARQFQSDTENVDLDIADLYLESRQFDKALKFLQELAVTQPRNPAVHESLDKLLAERKDFASAAQAFEKAIQLQTDPFRKQDLNYSLAGVYQELGRTDEAILRLNELAAVSTNPDLHFRLGTLYLHKRDLDSARREFQRVLDLKPDYAEAYSNLGSALILQENYREAIAALTRFTQYRPEVAGTYFYLAIAYDKLTDYPHAMANYQKFLEVGHGHSDKLEFQARERLKVLAKKNKTR